MNQSLTDSLFSSLESISDLNNDETNFQTDSEIFKLQNEILMQSKQIEDFLKSKGTKETSQQMEALKYLFALFKSELSVNLSLRRLLMAERQKSDQMSAEINNFLGIMNGLGLGEFSDFFSVIRKIKSLLKKLEKRENLKKAFKKEIKEHDILANTNRENEQKLMKILEEKEKLEKYQKETQPNLLKLTLENQQLTQNNENNEQKIRQLQAENEQLKINHQNFSSKYSTLENIQNELDSLKRNNSSQKSQIYSLQRENEDLNHQNQALRQENMMLSNEVSASQITQKSLEKQIKTQTNEIDKMRDKLMTNEREKCELQNKIQKLELSLKNQKQEIESNSQSYHSKLNKMNEILQENEIISKENSTFRRQIEDLNNALENKTKSLFDYEISTKQLKEDNEKQKISINSLQNEINEKKKTIIALQNQNREYEAMEKFIQKAINKKNKAEKAANAYKMKYDNLLRDSQRQIQEMKETSEKCIKEMQNEYENKLSRQEKEAKNNEESLLRSLNYKLENQISHSTLQERELKYQIEELQNANKSLKEQLRKMSFSLEQEEAEISRLQVELKAKTSLIINDSSSDDENDSSLI